jgi:prepilin-type N-terminal cleavage/methylation domain-containing protein
MYTVRTRRGMTLTEVLVVMAIIAVLVGLTLPAVQRVRASSARASCSNNLHQLAIAFQNYHATHDRLPSGVGATGPTDPYPYMNWHARLLPYLEQPALWELTLAAYRVDRRFTSNPPHSAREVVVPVFVCPADGRASSPLLGQHGYGPTSYLGVAGLNASRQDGVLYLGSNHRLGDISDGTSNTLLVGERPPSTDERFGWWYAGWGQNRDGECDGVLGVRTVPRPGLDYSCEGSP